MAKTVNYLKKYKYRRHFFPSSDVQDHGWWGSEIGGWTQRTDREETELQLKIRRRKSQISGGTKTGLSAHRVKENVTASAMQGVCYKRPEKKIKAKCQETGRKALSCTDYKEFKDSCMGLERNPVIGDVHIFLWFNTPTPPFCFNIRGFYYLGRNEILGFEDYWITWVMK